MVTFLSLVRSAAGRGVISQTASLALQSKAPMIEAVLAESFVPSRAAALLLVTLVPDDSNSIFDQGRAPSVIAGHNELMDMIRGAAGSRTMWQTRYLNGQVLNPFSPMALCQRLDTHNFRASPGGTPLYEQTLITLGAVLAKTEELVQNGSRIRTATLIQTDGEPTDWTNVAQERLASLVRDMRAIGDHIVAGMGVGHDSQFRQTFIKMGIDPRYIFTATSRAEILEALRVFGEAALELNRGK